VLFALCFSANAQQPKKIPRIGYLTAASLVDIADRAEAFRQGLRELGYVEGTTIVIEWRDAKGKSDRLPELAADLVRLKVDIIVTGGAGATRPAKEPTSSIPIVMAQDRDPVGDGFATSLARPGGNITGLASLYPEIAGKQLEILKEMIPKLTRVAVFGNPTRQGYAQVVKELEVAAEALRIQRQILVVNSPKDIGAAFRAASTGRADAVIVMGGPTFNSQRTRLAELAIKHRLRAMYDRPEYVDHGGLVTYSANIIGFDRRAATYVDKILKGARPADLPVEQPTKFELIVNLKTAKQIGLTIPPNVLARADRVIK
jgi:putative ABC transport system substrate-binding protein